MTNPDIASERLQAQQLVGSSSTRPADVVTFMGAMQAQDYAGAKWAIGLRSPGCTDSDVEQALAGGAIVRTWAMRGTLHFVASSDLRWLLDLVAPRVIAGNSRRYRELGLDSGTLARSSEVLTDALDGGKRLDRRALRVVLEEAGVSTEGQRFPYMLQRASLEGRICQIGLERNNPVFVQPDKRVPDDPIRDRDGAVAALAARYFTSRGPATLEDFTWWSGLPAAEARAGLESVQSEFSGRTIDGRRYFGVMHRTTGEGNLEPRLLLPGFDEFLISYKDRSAMLGRAGGKIRAPTNGAPVPTLVSGGQVLGTWRRMVKKESVIITPSPFTRLSETEDLAFADAARRYGEFLGLQAVWDKRS